MKEMYYVFGLAGWIWLGMVAPLIVGFAVAKWRRGSVSSGSGSGSGGGVVGAGASSKDGRPVGDAAGRDVRGIETRDEKQP